MIRILVAVAAVVAAQPALSQERSRAEIDVLIARHAAANNVPESLVRRVIVRESKYNARAVGRGGTMGLMQIKHATARGVGYTGAPAGLLDPDTNLTYAVRYLAGAYRVAGGNESRAVSYYAGGYYHHAKRQGLTGKTYAAASAVSVPAAAPDAAAVPAAAPVLAAAPTAAEAPTAPAVAAPMLLVVAPPKGAAAAKPKARTAKASKTAAKTAPAAAPETPETVPEVEAADGEPEQPISAVSPSDRDFPH